jgi:hypothetical protein
MKRLPSKTTFLLASATAASLFPSIAKAAVALTQGPVDVADFKPTAGDVAFGFPTSNGNDNNTGNFTHADNLNPPPNNPFWEVDLQGTFNLINFGVTDRAGCCDPNRLNGSTVTLLGAGGSVIATQSIGGIPNGTFGSVFNFDNGGAGYSGVQRVRIDGSTQYFQFAEFDAIANLTTPVNWALGAAAQFYSAGGSPVQGWPGFPASFITDGIFTTFTHPDNPTPHGGYYAEIDLGQSIFIDNITLTGRLDGCCPERLVGYDVQFFDAAHTLVHTINHPGGTTPTETIDVIGGFGGLGPQTRFLRVVNANGADYGPQVGELQVFGVIPEPSAAVLLALGACGLRRRRR